MYSGGLGPSGHRRSGGGGRAQLRVRLTEKQGQLGWASLREGSVPPGRTHQKKLVLCWSGMTLTPKLFLGGCCLPTFCPLCLYGEWKMCSLRWCWPLYRSPWTWFQSPGPAALPVPWTLVSLLLESYLFPSTIFSTSVEACSSSVSNLGVVKGDVADQYDAHCDPLVGITPSF